MRIAKVEVKQGFRRRRRRKNTATLSQLRKRGDEQKWAG